MHNKRRRKKGKEGEKNREMEKLEKRERNEKETGTRDIYSDLLYRDSFHLLKQRSYEM